MDCISLKTVNLLEIIYFSSLAAALQQEYSKEVKEKAKKQKTIARLQTSMTYVHHRQMQKFFLKAFCSGFNEQNTSNHIRANCNKVNELLNEFLEYQFCSGCTINYNQRTSQSEYLIKVNYASKGENNHQTLV